MNERRNGSEPYPPSMLLGMLVYNHATGVFSRRQIECTTYQNVAVPLLWTNSLTDHDTLGTFRRQNGPP